ncbi:conserved hypothetical protein [Ricinus communis]|uniref:Uncharacterized protein n=1 Tax=Ricinus communis TaxID=3988 RepID=B9SY52_RICCO|nr:conserved hypothetical protein [Ricinus communis]
MSIPASTVAAPSQTSNFNVNRQSANFHPSIWDGHFPSYHSDNSMDENSRNKASETEGRRKKDVNYGERG